MANIAVRSESGNRPLVSTTPSVEWDPFRMMRRMLAWDPFGEMVPLAQEERELAFVPAFEVKETKSGYVFKADVPGVKDNQLDITVTGNRLSVTGRRETEKQDQNDRYYTYERSYGAFTRTFTLPESADAKTASADLKDGVLTINVARKAEMQPQKIEVKPATTKS